MYFSIKKICEHSKQYMFEIGRTRTKIGCKMDVWMNGAFYGLLGKIDFEIWFYTTLNIHNMNTHQTENTFIRLLTWILMGYAAVIYIVNGLSNFYDYLNFIGPLCFKITFILMLKSPLHRYLRRKLAVNRIT